MEGIPCKCICIGGSEWWMPASTGIKGAGGMNSGGGMKSKPIPGGGGGTPAMDNSIPVGGGGTGIGGDSMAGCSIIAVKSSPLPNTKPMGPGRKERNMETLE